MPMWENRYVPAGLFLLLLFVLSVRPALADEYHYNNILIGERASGMAGAYTAVSDDLSGLYYNPAGVVYATGRNLSASVNTFHRTKKLYKGVIGGHGWTRTASTLLPNFFGILQSLGKGKIGFSYAVTDSILEDQDQRILDTISTALGNITSYVINFNNEDNTYNLGPSYARELGDNLSAGITLYIHQRRQQWILNQLIHFDTGQYEWSNIYYETEETGVRPVLGLMWSPADKVAFGLSVSKTEVLTADTTLQSTVKTTISNDVTFEKPTSTAKRQYPLTATVGAAYFPSEALLLSGDFSYYSAVNGRVATWNAAVGSEYYFTKSLSLRTGFFTNRANTPELKTGSTGQDEHVDLYGGSLSLGYYSRGTSLSLGGTYSSGTGKAQIISEETSTQDTEMQSLSIFLAASYSY